MAFRRAVASMGTAEEALAAFYAYESQVPRISREKLRGFEKVYDADGRTCAYFILHTIADIYHSRVWRIQLEKRLLTNPERSDAALKAGEAAARTLGEAVDGIEDKRQERLPPGFVGFFCFNPTEKG